MALDKLGPYRFKGVLGRGGMGTVYRGEHEESGEFHAVKVLSPNFSDDEHFRGRFESEIKALLKLNHPNIVQLLSFGQEDGMLFFAMELVEGNSLFQMQRQGHRFDWREVLTIARDVCQGLKHAHDRGVIHRDLKPGNLLMTTSTKEDDPTRNLPGVVKLTDFGIAKSYGSSQNTGTNVLGTMDFMSPEQAKGEPTTFRSDLYSLGTVMFTLLAGKPPFASKSVEQGIHNLIHVSAPPISSIVPGIPSELDDLISQLMAKKPEERIPNTLALSKKLDNLEETLRYQAEAKTAEVSGVTMMDDSLELVNKSVGSQTTDVEPGRRKKFSARMGGGRTAEYSEHDKEQIRRESEAGSSKPRLNRSSDTRDNYFNTVTDQLRKQQENADLSAEKKAEKGKLPLLLALLAVVGLGVFGLYFVLTPPSADKLFKQIEAEKLNPLEVLPEIERFLDVYPKDSNAVKVQSLGSIAKAIQFHNLLSARKAFNRKRLSPMEKQFLDIVELAETDSTEGNRKMAAFVKLAELALEEDELTDSDTKLLEHAKGYRAKIRSDARNTVATNLKQIRSAMDKAAKNPSEAELIYGSILELYENRLWGEEGDGPEGRRLVLEAARLLDQGRQ